MYDWFQVDVRQISLIFTTPKAIKGFVEKLTVPNREGYVIVDPCTKGELVAKSKVKIYGNLNLFICMKHCCTY